MTLCRFFLNIRPWQQSHALQCKVKSSLSGSELLRALHVSGLWEV